MNNIIKTVGLKPFQRSDEIFSSLGLGKDSSSLLHRFSLVDLGYVMIKDERDRFGLGSFKALGGVYAVAKSLEDYLQSKHNLRVPVRDILTGEAASLIKSITFVCASAGNHGLAVATGAALFGVCARIYLPFSTPQHFAERLIKIGAEVIIEGQTYENAMFAARADASTTESIYLSDSSSDLNDRGSYYIMEGYTRIAHELAVSFRKTGVWPTDIFIQAGVGGLAAAISQNIRNTWDEQPKIYIVEPDSAACLAQSAIVKRAVSVDGPPSNMHRLDCKEPSVSALQRLNQCNVEYISVTDEEATDAVFSLSKIGFRTSASGAAGFAGLRQVGGGRSLNRRSVILLTEQEDLHHQFIHEEVKADVEA